AHASLVARRARAPRSADRIAERAHTAFALVGLPECTVDDERIRSPVSVHDAALGRAFEVLHPTVRPAMDEPSPAFARRRSERRSEPLHRQPDRRLDLRLLRVRDEADRLILGEVEVARGLFDESAALAIEHPFVADFDEVADRKADALFLVDA